MATRKQKEKPLPFIETQFVRLVDQKGNGRALLGTDVGGVPHLWFLSAEGKKQVVLTPGGFTFYDEDGSHVRATLDIDKEDGVRLGLCDDEHHQKLVLTVGNWPGKAQIRVYDIKGKLAWASPERWKGEG